jgi:hemolysin III
VCGRVFRVAEASTNRQVSSMADAAPSAYTRGEELANVLTHGIGAALSVAGLAVLVTLTSLHGDAWRVTATAIFGATLVLLYTSSTLYHSFRGEPLKRLLRKFDHASIFLLIAGTYTPFLLVNLRGPWGWSLFAVIWTLAIVGVVLKFWLAGRFRLASTLLYVGMGWLVVIAARPMLRVMPTHALWLLLAGGLTYTGGTVFYLWKRLPYHHAIWHLFVLGGSACHFFAVLAAVSG